MDGPLKQKLAGGYSDKPIHAPIVARVKMKGRAAMRRLLVDRAEVLGIDPKLTRKVIGK